MYQIFAEVVPTLVLLVLEKPSMKNCCVFSETDGASFPFTPSMPVPGPVQLVLLRIGDLFWVLLNCVVMTTSTLHVLPVHKTLLKLF